VLAELRAEIAALAGNAERDAGQVMPFGVTPLDVHLADGGLRLDALHDFAPASTAMGDEAAAALFVAGLGARAALRRDAPALWVGGGRDLFAPGLAQAGLDPARLIRADAGCEEDMLAAMEDGLRHGALGAVIGETAKIGMVALRRLQLAAAEGGTPALLLRRWRRSGIDPLAQPSIAVTRWRIATAPSLPLPVPGVGRACWHVELVRQRGGPEADWIVEGCDAEGRLALPAGSGDRSAAADRRTDRQAA
jgi:protein ImuA